MTKQITSNCRYVLIIKLAMIFFVLGMTELSFARDWRQVRLVKRELNSEVVRSEFSTTRDWFYTTLEINYLALNALDLLTTFYSLEKGAQEMNPISDLYIRNKPVAIAVKAGTTLGVLQLLRYVEKENETAAYVTLGALNLLYGFVVHNNISVYLRLE